MKTQVFNSYSEFLERPDKNVNGVSEDFARSNPDYEEDNRTNIGCWNCHNCKYLRNCKNCENCKDCYYSLNLRNCKNCHNLRNFKNCHNLSIFNNEVENLQIPIIENIHSKVFEATKNGQLLDMDIWHSPCGTTHCRAGWVVALAGEQGSKLEDQTSTPFAASCIYSKSSNIKVPSSHFYLSNEESMKDIALCAKLEMEGKTQRNK